MSWGLPKQPGMQFADPTKSRFSVNQSLKFDKGYAFPSATVVGTGGSFTDVQSNTYTTMDDSCNYDPSLTYGRVKQPAPDAVIPKFVLYDKRALKFRAFMKQPVYESTCENYRVRYVDLLYFLEDDSMTVMEPQIKNCGLWQGRMVKRGKIPKNDLGDFYHWRDLNVGRDVPIYGKVFHTVSCDLYTKEYLESQGVEVDPFEEMPVDPYFEKKQWRHCAQQLMTEHKSHEEDTLGRYLKYNGMVLTFNCVWDDRDSAHGEMRDYKILFFLEDNTISVKELYDRRGGRDPFPMLLKKCRLPKRWKDRPSTFPAVYLETTEAEIPEYYSPRDLIVGETVFVLGRRFLLYDCDEFTRQFYRTSLNIEQPSRVHIPTKTYPEFPKTFPPHINIGTPEDALQSCFGLIPKPPKKDVIKYNLNANKNLRYLCELEIIRPEDKGRKFVLSYSLADGSIRVGEIPRRNSGIREGCFLANTMLQVPESDPNFPTYYTPDRFYIGAVIPINKFRFKIIGCDLYVYRYMCANPDKFPQDVVDNVRNYHMREGNLKDDFKEAVADDDARVKQARLAAIGSEAVKIPTAMEQCLAALDVVEGSAAPVRPPTPPATTDNIPYDEALRKMRESVPPCDSLAPLKGILKTGEARDDHQKVVCFTAPAPEEKSDGFHKPYGLMAPEHGFCDQFRDPDREDRRARNECPYPPIPGRAEREQAAAAVAGTVEDAREEIDCSKYAATFGVPEKAKKAAEAVSPSPPVNTAH